jgi:signal transduction histidine kinase
MRISSLIFSGFLFILLLFSLTTFINFRQSEAARENSEYFSHSTNVVRQANRFQRNNLNIVSSLRGYLLTGERSFLQAYDSATAENEMILKELEAIGSNDPRQKARLNRIRILAKEWNGAYTPLRFFTVRDSSDASLNTLHRGFKQQFAQIETGSVNRELNNELRNYLNREYQNRDEQKEKLDQSLQRTKSISFYLTVSSIVAGLCIALFLAYRISTRILYMVSIADGIAAGNYKVKIPDKRNDELGSLASSLNHMSEVLDENFSQLERKNKELDQFAHIVSHDMKAPLRGIANVISWIEEDHDAELTPRIRDYLNLIKGRVVRAENLIGGILTYARVGKETRAVEPVDINALIDEVMEDIPVPHKFRLVKTTALPVIEAEKLPLFQVFTNLVSNAVKYNDKPECIVKIGHQESGDHYSFIVEDNGPGIESSYHEKIFVIFQTLQERDSFESTGVGLAIVKKILDERGESITVRSTPGAGSAFSFTWHKQI